MNSRAGHRMSPCPTPTWPNRGVANRRPQIEHIMRDCRAAWSTLWWWPCFFQGDCKGKVGADAHEQLERTVGRYGVGETNERGERLLKFAWRHKVTLVNTLSSLQENNRAFARWRHTQSDRLYPCGAAIQIQYQHSYGQNFSVCGDQRRSRLGYSDNEAEIGGKFVEPGKAERPASSRPVRGQICSA